MMIEFFGLEIEIPVFKSFTASRRSENSMCDLRRWKAYSTDKQTNKLSGFVHFISIVLKYDYPVNSIECKLEMENSYFKKWELKLIDCFLLLQWNKQYTVFHGKNWKLSFQKNKFVKKIRALITPLLNKNKKY